MLKKGRISHEINDRWNEKMKSFTPIMGPRAHLFKDFLRVLRYNYSTTNVLLFLGASQGVLKHNFVNWLAQLPKSQPDRPLSSYPPFKRLPLVIFMSKNNLLQHKTKLHVFKKKKNSHPIESTFITKVLHPFSWSVNLKIYFWNELFCH